MSNDTTTSLAIFFARGNSWFDQALQNALRARNLPTTSHTEGLVLGYVGIDITRPSVIARLIGVSAQALTQPLTNLRERGFIVSRQDPDDARARILELTEYGEDYLQQVRVLMRHIESGLEEKFGKPLIDIVRMVVKADWGPPPGGDGELSVDETATSGEDAEPVAAPAKKKAEAVKKRRETPEGRPSRSASGRASRASSKPRHRTPKP